MKSNESKASNALILTDPFDEYSSYWTREKKKQHQERMDRLHKSPEHSLIHEIQKRFNVDHKTLCQNFLGLGKYSVNEGALEDVLFVPYLTGCSALYYNEEQLCRVDLPGSDPNDTFFGINFISGKMTLIVTESIFDAMLLRAQNSDYDIISVIDKTEMGLSDGQKELLLKIHDNGCKRLYVFSTGLNVNEKKASRSYARLYADCLPLDSEIYWVNIPDITHGAHHYLSDCLTTGYPADVLFEVAPYIWNTETNNKRFWKTTGKKPKLIISDTMLANVLHELGITKTYLDESGDPTLIMLQDQVAWLTSPHIINDIIKEQIMDKLSKYVDVADNNDLMSSEDLNDAYSAYRTKLINSKFKAIIRRVELPLLEEDRNNAYLYYENGVIHITPDSIDLLNYEDLPGAVWKNQIFDRAVNRGDHSHQKSIFEQFVEHVSGEDVNRMKSIRSHIGYLLHAYKDRSKTVAVILTDENLAEGKAAEGGTGKSLFAHAFSYWRKCKYIAGKNLNIKDKFALMDTELDDQILLLDDVRQDFDFEGLFNVITNDMQIEAKYKNRFTIPFERSPKVLIATNKVLEGKGNSFTRRQSVIEFSDHYLRNPGPKEYFGHTLFSDWDTQEWNRFDNYGFRCLQEYLRDDLHSFPIVNYEKKRAIADTCYDFIHWAEEHLETGLRYSANMLFDGRNVEGNDHQKKSNPVNSKGKPFHNFLEAHPGLLSGNQMRTFNIWIKRFAEYREWNQVITKRDGYIFIEFS